ncbi:hypothetical protein MNBD_PLANCTO02-2041 [hydrothermal vent metagenome]|uniref:Uncharacterized protein n=1 Tax=hydrothermal vent metagenome TaxID=652676 RepID=A0A3B1E0K6_9ZZZZ
MIFIRQAISQKKEEDLLNIATNHKSAKLKVTDSFSFNFNTEFT